MIEINNPLNIRHYDKNHWQGLKGTHRGFDIFESMTMGYRAAFVLLSNHWERGRHNLVFLLDKWAPASDGNNPEAYARDVGRMVGVNPYLTLPRPQDDAPLWIRIAAAMTVIENGIRRNQVDYRALREGYRLAFGIKLIHNA